jgi:hypothetical protein
MGYTLHRRRPLDKADESMGRHVRYNEITQTQVKPKAK